MKRPAKDEYEVFYETYVSKVPDGAVLESLAAAPGALEALLADVSSADETFAYAPGKWSIRQVLGHVLDTERVFTYRALHMARADSTQLPGMDQHVWASASNAGGRPLRDLLLEFRALRQANAALFASLDDEALSRQGVASGCGFTVRALVHIVAGHEIHHRDILAERYLPQLPGAGSDPARVEMPMSQVEFYYHRPG